MSDFRCRSAFCVINNPRYDITYKHDESGEIVKDENGKAVILKQDPTEYYSLTEQQICDDVLNKWVGDDDKKTGAVLFCVSSLGLEHLHCVFESDKTFRPLSALKKLFPKVHIEITKGNKQQVEDYINKVGKFEEKGEKIIAKSQVGEIKGCQGERNDLISLSDIRDMIYSGQTPKQIYRQFPQALKSKSATEELFYLYRSDNTPVKRDVNVNWLFGSTGCGKSYTYVELVEKHGEENVYLVSDYEHPFDNYQGEPIVIFDEFRGRIPYSNFLGMLDCYKQQVSARYSNKLMLWTDVYITSPFLPFELYQSVRERNDKYDSLAQLIRRINKIYYCFKHEDKDSTFYYKYDLPFDIDDDGEALRHVCSSIKSDVCSNDDTLTIMDGLTWNCVDKNN